MFDRQDYTSSGELTQPGDDSPPSASPPLAIVHNGGNRSLSLFPGMIERDRKPAKKKSRSEEEEKKAPTRGVVYGFSRKSRGRLIRKIRQYEFREGHVAFSSLTYPKEYPSLSDCKRHLNNFIDRVQYRLGKDRCGIIWRIEPQRATPGRPCAPHFHLMIYSAYLLDEKAFADWVYDAWVDVVGSSDPLHRSAGHAADTQLMKTDRGVSAYLSKYLAKEPKQPKVQTKGGAVDVYYTLPGRQWGTSGKFPIKTVEFQGSSQDISSFWRILTKSQGLSGHAFKPLRGSERRKFRKARRALKAEALASGQRYVPPRFPGHPWKSIFCPGLHPDWLRLASLFSVQVDCLFEDYYIDSFGFVPW